MSRIGAAIGRKSKEKTETASKPPETPGGPALTVKMVRDEKSADVHPSEVENWKAAGWKLKEKEN